MPSYLLDTDILSNLMRDPRGRVAQRIARLDEQAVCTSAIVIAEIRYGIAKIGSQRLADQLSAILGGLDVLPFEAPADVRYGEIRARLERTGNVIGANDMLIGAHALALGLTLVTANEREFARVRGLAIENWLR